MLSIKTPLPADVEILWNYNQMGHEVRPVDVGIGLGSHDLGVATDTADLYHQGMFPLIVFNGANAPTTVEKFPRGEAVHSRETPSAASSVAMRRTDHLRSRRNCSIRTTTAAMVALGLRRGAEVGHPAR